MRRTLLSLLGIVIVVALIVGPVVYAFHEEKQMRNFRVVREGVLYRSARMTLPGLKRAVHDYGIRTVVCLREGDRPADLAEEAYCAREEINFYRLPPKHWDTSNGPAEAEVNVRQFRDILDDPDNYPILVHCFAGVHRTGTLCAVYRMEYQGWTADRALAEMEEYGFEPGRGREAIEGYLRAYRPRRSPR